MKYEISKVVKKRWKEGIYNNLGKKVSKAWKKGKYNRAKVTMSKNAKQQNIKF
jgi:hypothetical protein